MDSNPGIGVDAAAGIDSGSAIVAASPPEAFTISELFAEVAQAGAAQ